MTCRLIFSLTVQRLKPSHSYHVQHTAFSFLPTGNHFNVLPDGRNEISMTKISVIVLSLAQIFSDEANQRFQMALWFGIAGAHSGSKHAVRHTSTAVPETALVLSSNKFLGQD